LPQRKVFQDEFLVAAERQRECADDHDEQLQHAVIVAGVGAKFNSDEFWRGSGFFVFGIVPVAVTVGVPWGIWWVAAGFRNERKAMPAKPTVDTGVVLTKHTTRSAILYVVAALGLEQPAMQDLMLFS
jgi:hypothetical protein